MSPRLRPGLLLASLAITACATARHYNGPAVDAHAHLRLGANDAIGAAHRVGVDDLLQLDREAGVVRSALIIMASSGNMARTRARNDSLLAVVAAHPGRFHAVASVHPFDSDSALVELERLARHGVRQVKLHPNSQQFDVADPRVARVTGKAGELGMSVLFDAYNPLDPGQFGKLLALSMAQPRTRFVLAHMGFAGFRETMAFALLRKLGAPRNVWLDVSAIAVAYARSPLAAELVWTMRQVGIDRILFGSDWPVDTPGVARAAVRALGLTAAEERAVLHDNALSLLGLEVSAPR